MSEQQQPRVRPRIPVEVPTNDQKRPIYRPEHLSDYKAVIQHEAIRKAAGDPKKLKDAKMGLLMIAGGSSGKSALLNRIASGLWPLVASPPISHSYPWYSVIEDATPQELWLDSASAEELLEAGQRSKDWLRTALEPHIEDDHWAKDLGEEERQNLRQLLSEQGVPIDQSIWKVVRVVGKNHLEVTWPGWEQLGFLWRLSIDEVPAAKAQQAICSWHSKTLGRITTFDQLVLEQRWHVNKRVEEIRMATDPELAQERLKSLLDADIHNATFIENSFKRNLAAKAELVKERLAQGKSAVPNEAEIEQMFQEGLQRHLTPKSGSGCGWYSVAEDGSLVLHTWRITRLTPVELPESIYLDPRQLPRSDD